MKTVLLLLWLFCVSQLFAQPQIPSYPDVLVTFFKKHSFRSHDPVDGLNFAKKKEGWFVQVVDRITEDVRGEQRLWSAKEGWETVYLLDTASSADEQSKKVYAFLMGQEGMYAFTGYERCRYYGYSGWDEDMIQDFGQQPLNLLNDTLLEGLGRAYSAYSTRFSWLQYGGRKAETDSLKRKLGLLERPSVRRVDSMEFYIRKAIGCYAALKNRNANYRTLVGNSGMKHFNEQIFGYNQMMMAGFEKKAKDFIHEIVPNQTVLCIAKNFLDNCPPDAILFSNGDADTYTLWYMQEALNYRKDVSVLNQSLLGLPIYVDQQRRNKSVVFSMPATAYGDPSFTYAVYEESGGIKAETPLPRFLTGVFQREQNSEISSVGAVPAYNVKQAFLPVNLVKFGRISMRAGYGNAIRFSFKDYLTLDQIVMLDIIRANLYNRPICFTYKWDLCPDHQESIGTVTQLLPLNPAKAQANQAASVRRMQSFLNTTFQLISSADTSTGIAPPETFDGINSAVYGQVVQWEWENSKKVEAMGRLNRLKEFYKDVYVPMVDGYLGYLFLSVGDAATGLQILETNAQWIYDLYKNPSAIHQIMTQDSAKKAIAKTQTQLAAVNLKSQKIDALIALLQD